LVDPVAASIELDRHSTVSAIAYAKGGLVKTIQIILTDEQGLVKKFSCLGLLLLSSEQKRRGQNHIMDKSAGTFYTKD